MTPPPDGSPTAATAVCTRVLAPSSESAATAVTSFSFEAGMRDFVPFHSYTGVPLSRTTETDTDPLRPLAEMNFARVFGEAAWAGEVTIDRDQHGNRCDAGA